MTQTVSRQTAVITGFRQSVPAHCATAQAIDRQEPWERIALLAADDGFVDFANALVEACLRRNP
jgi:hypothetical protein